MSTDHLQLADRVRTMLAAEPSRRELLMFGGLSFMVNEKLVVSLRRDGDLLARVDPERAPELVALPGVRPGEMGAGRVMGPGWIDVAGEVIATDEQLSFWIRLAMEHNDRTARVAHTERGSRIPCDDRPLARTKDTVMPNAMPVAELLFEDADATPMSTDEATVKPWIQARRCLESAAKVWLSTLRPDDRPHVTPLLLVWIDDTPCFATRPMSRKARNLARNPRCVLTVAGEDLDLVVEGTATRTTDPSELLRVAAAFQEKYEWALTVRNGRVHDHRLPGPPEYSFYRVTPTLAFGYGADGLTATRWRFTSDRPAVHAREEDPVEELAQPQPGAAELGDRGHQRGVGVGCQRARDG